MKQELKKDLEAVLKSQEYLLPIIEKGAASEKPAPRWSYKYNLNDVKRCKSNISFLQSILNHIENLIKDDNE